MNNHQQMAVDDIAIIGTASVVLWYMTFTAFGWGRLIGAVLATAYVGLRIYHMHAWKEEDKDDLIQ